MRWPLVTRRSHDETVALKDRLIDSLDKTADLMRRQRNDARAELDRLRKLVPDRDAKGHFVPRAKEVRRG